MRRWIGILLTCGACSIASAQGFLGLGSFLKLRQLTVPQNQPSASELGIQAEARLEWTAAFQHYERAVQEVKAHPELFRNEALRNALPRLARASMQIGRLDVAENALMTLQSLPSRPTENGFADVMKALEAAMQSGVESARALNQRIYVEGEDSDLVDAYLSPRLPTTADNLALWAELRARQGQHQEVLRLWRDEFKATQTNASNTNDQTFAKVLSDTTQLVAWRFALALMHGSATLEAERATSVALSAGREQLRRLIVEAPLLETQLAAMQRQRWVADTALELVLRTGGFTGKPEQQHLLSWALSEVLTSKGMAARVQQRRRELLSELDTLDTRTARTKLIALERELVILPTDGARGIEAWADWMSRQAKVLAPVQSALANAGLSDTVSDGEKLLTRMRERLLPDEALIGFVVHQPFDLKSGRPGQTSYVRYTLLNDGRVSLRNVGPKRQIDQLLASYRRGVATGDTATSASQALSSALLADLDPIVKQRSHWIIEAEGQLGLLPFEALPEGKRLVLEGHQVRYLSDAAQLASTLQQASKGEAVVLADPVYGSLPLSGEQSLRPFLLAQGGALRDQVFRPLPETRAESAAVASALARLGISTRQLYGSEAVPAALIGTKAPSYLHIASHAFVLAPAPDANPTLRNRVRIAAAGQLAGIVLSTGKDGPLLMGTDLATLDLRGTRLVVLSACDTGNGNVDVHLGLRTLRSALEEAGAQASVTSLWPVPSAPTVNLMSEFYAQLSAGRGRAEALQISKLKLMRSGGAPRDWAGFLLAGVER